MDEGSGYCGSGSEIESVSNAAKIADDCGGVSSVKIANMVMTGAGEG